MTFNRTQVAIVVGAAALIGAGWLIGASTGDQASPLPKAQAALNETPAKAGAAGSPTAVVDAPTTAVGQASVQDSAPAVARLGSAAVTQDDRERLLRPEEHRVGKGWGSTCRTGWPPAHSKK